MKATSLTADEVAALPEGVAITVLWSGGNGPHQYRIAVDRFGQRYAATRDENLRFYNPLQFVGQQKWHTRVWLTPPQPDNSPAPAPTPEDERP